MRLGSFHTNYCSNRDGKRMVRYFRIAAAIVFFSLTLVSCDLFSEPPPILMQRLLVYKGNYGGQIDSVIGIAVTVRNVSDIDLL